jgi:hypothetical protein
MLTVPGLGAVQHGVTLVGGDEAHPASMATNKSTRASRTIDLTKASYAAANSFVALTGSLSALHNALRLASRGRV